MEELVQIITSKTGISDDQARAAIQAVIQHLESKMSPEMSGILNTVLASEGTGAGAAGSNPLVTEAESVLRSTLGGFFNK